MSSIELVSEVAFFRTSLGWMGLSMRKAGIHRLVFGYSTREQVQARFDESALYAHSDSEEIRAWIEQLSRYANGESYDFLSLTLDWTELTEFQRSVLQGCREIPHGGSLTYGQLADRIGHPGTARAVGTVMRTNRLPIIIPCHRVVAQSGLGQFSAPRGTEMKRRLLVLEGNPMVQERQRWLFG